MEWSHTLIPLGEHIYDEEIIDDIINHYPRVSLFVKLGEEEESHKLLEIELKLDSTRNIYNHLPVLRKMAANRVLFCSLFTETRSSPKKIKRTMIISKTRIQRLNILNIS